MNRVGIIVGSGTGRECAHVFNTAVSRIADKLGQKVEVVTCDHEFKSYHILLNEEPDTIEQCATHDLGRMIEFYRDFYSAGGRAIFRTALNAETLYRFRSFGKAVKTVRISSQGKTILFVRDQLQGFYVNDAYTVDSQAINFSGSFSLENFKLLKKCALAEAQTAMRPGYSMWLVYKHHLFANVIESWANELFPAAKICQPNHATEMLCDYFDAKDAPDLLLLTGNEIGDILHEVLILQLGLGTRNTLYSRNVYMHPDFDGLVEYQTVHGSADNIAEQGLVNPLATLRAVGAFVEEHLHEENFIAEMDKAIGEVEAVGPEKIVGGGRSFTHTMSEAVLKLLEC